MDFISEICYYAKKPTYYTGLEALIKKKMDGLVVSTQSPPSYFYMHDLINPAQKYWSKECPDVERSKEQTRILNHGVRLQGFASPWFRGIEGFSVEEGLLDGALVDLPGVRGKIDFMIKDSIIELKTKREKLSADPKTIMENYIQDIEQLSFYSVLHPLTPKINYLVFMESERPHSIKAFKLEIKDENYLRELVRSRIKLLTEILSTKDHKRLFRCRYFDTNLCHFQEKKACSCRKLAAWDNSKLLEAVSFSFDQAFTDKIEESRKKYGESKSEVFSLYDLLAPRKRYMKRILETEEKWKDDSDKYQYESCLWKSLNSLNYFPNENEKIELLEMSTFSEIQIPFRWLKIPSSTSTNGTEKIPYLLKVSGSNSDYALQKPSDYWVAELGVACAAQNRSKGFIIVVFPKRDKFVRVFQIEYVNLEEMRKMIRKQLDQIKMAEDQKSLIHLTPCPKYMNNNSTCPIMELCHANGTLGCKDLDRD